MPSDGLVFNDFSLDDLVEEFEASTVETRRESKKLMLKGAKKIMEASKQMTPVDEGNLEAAHSIETIRLNEDFMQLEISVGGVHGGRNVDEYAAIVHESVSPAGSKKLGPRSLAKDAGNPADRRVGGKFLERAVDIYEDQIIADLKETLPGAK